MNMQQMLQQAQRMKRELEKAQNQLKETEFTVTKGGAVTVVVYGSKKIKSITIDKDAFEADNKEMIEDLIAVSINELNEQIDKAEAEINERITGSAGGFGF